ncbi:MAG: DNA-3-methyladenine glycosylase [Thermoleophilaceae bacterium]|nr:DNA-3-methyladenine glycosylase [Thermoleophilaceae bacterium]
MNFARSVHEVARDLVGMTLRHGPTAGRIVEVESYHQEEPACHAFIGPRPRTEVLFGPPGRAYVYRSYGIHALVNVVAEEDGVGAAVLIRALEPLDGIELMRERRRVARDEDLTNGPGKLTEALAIGLDLNGVSLEQGPIRIGPPGPGAREARVVTGPRIGITKAIELPWRFCDATSGYVSRPWPPAMKKAPATRGVAA